ncbi:class I SAM-dependent methyltransferase [Seleniivibrio woodruffii]|uniref:class I SAM-dependent methyltransferase n=1 Tax=Seleniivibrio woodruffii TaxID=1078050 RepID=UPI0026F1D7F5|nr:class I SAM-dependent methyltransferase [Seleniivibrio woodruffii]
MSKSGSYRLLDSGLGRKLEDVGGFIIDRPCGQAVWEKTLKDGRWQEVHAIFSREGGSSWSYRKNMPAEWIIDLDGLKFYISPTDFGHLGVFPEHRYSWGWVRERIQNAKKPLRVLNLFSYSGAATLAAAKEGADVTHVDASQKINDLAKRNMKLNEINPQKVRFITDDVIKYLKREEKRGSKYDGVILDPPSFGRGSKGEVFKIDTHLPEILKLIKKVLNPNPSFVVLTCHTPGYTPMTLKNLLTQMMAGVNGDIETSELTLDRGETEIPVPAGFFAAWKQQGL